MSFNKTPSPGSRRCRLLMSAHIHRDERTHADPHPDGSNVLHLHVDSALRHSPLLATASQQLSRLYRATTTSFHAPLPNAPLARALSTITGDTPRPLSACDDDDNNDGMCLSSLRSELRQRSIFFRCRPRPYLGEGNVLAYPAPESPAIARLAHA
jgi:hypothetical protein